MRGRAVLYSMYFVYFVLRVLCCMLRPGGVTAKDSAETTKPGSPHYWLTRSVNQSPMIARPAPGMYRSVDRGGWGTHGS